MNIVARAHQRAGALHAADLVRRKRQQIGAERADIARDASRRLHGVDMEKAARRVHDGGRFRDRLDHAGLVVGEHERDERPRRSARTAPRSAGKIERARRNRPEFPRSPRAANRPPARTEECSIAEIKSRSRGRFSLAVSIAGVSASILASVPLDGENHIGPAARRPARATSSRACSIRCRAARPSACTDDGLPAATARRKPRAPRPQRRRGVPVEIAALRHALSPDCAFHEPANRSSRPIRARIAAWHRHRYACFLPLGLC